MQKVLLFAFTAAVAACNDFTPPSVGDTMLLSVIPVGGATNVDPNDPIAIEFSHAMAAHMEGYVALHEGSGVEGPILEGTWMWSEDRTHLSFTPSVPLKPSTTYSLHVGGGMTDSDGHIVDLDQHGQMMGGDWVTQHMMDQRNMGGMHGGMMDDMTGTGWRHANGSYGMIFTFTTA